MSERLEEALAMSQAAIEEGLAQARTELETVRARETELVALIARGEAALGVALPEAPLESRLTLHEALEQVLNENGNRWTTVRELTNEVNRRGLYRRKDGTPVDVNQVHARTKNYDKLFDKDGAHIRLRAGVQDWDVVIFRDDDEGFHGWLDAHNDGFFINAERNPKPNYLVLHTSGGCGHFDRSPSVQWTKDYIKICSHQRKELEDWASQSVGGEPTLCGHCFG